MWPLSFKRCLDMEVLVLYMDCMFVPPNPYAEALTPTVMDGVGVGLSRGDRVQMKEVRRVGPSRV